MLRHMILKYLLEMNPMSLKWILLGVADLNTPEAVAAAESAIAGNQPVIRLAASSSEAESDDGGGDSDYDENNEDNGNDDNKAYSPMTLETSEDDSSSKSAKKHPRIIELS
ncbi:hypothetical protein SLEP1_g33436 [Rubroshorea leprosula]|uniref:Uncharacterized protein n=1 Tax=Rubroshorea leprosula TaxID=152421 RepID=A0AAV5KGK6_9ROSI|nr:hypothetical protein SLEP1_g33436 [Rubroshorea leprosula]